MLNAFTHGGFDSWLHEIQRKLTKNAEGQFISLISVGA